MKEERRCEASAMGEGSTRAVPMRPPPSLALPRKGEGTATVIASEAKQSISARKKLDCFVASLLAMTSIPDTASHSRGVIAPESCINHPPHEGVGNAGCSLHP